MKSNTVAPLMVHRCEDSRYDINWVAVNCPTVMLDRNYKERHEPTYSGVSLIAQNPDNPDWLMEYGHNEEGFMSVSDFTKHGREFEVVSFDSAIKALLNNTKRALAEMKE